MGVGTNVSKSLVRAVVKMAGAEVAKSVVRVVLGLGIGVNATKAAARVVLAIPPGAAVTKALARAVVAFNPGVNVDKGVARAVVAPLPGVKTSKGVARAVTAPMPGVKISTGLARAVVIGSGRDLTFGRNDDSLSGANRFTAVPDGRKYATRFEVYVATRVVSLGVYLFQNVTNAPWRMAVYSDGSDHGAPDQLIVVSADQSGGRAGFNEAPLAEEVVLEPGAYWLTCHVGGGANSVNFQPFYRDWAGGDTSEIRSPNQWHRQTVYADEDFTDGIDSAFGSARPYTVSGVSIEMAFVALGSIDGQSSLPTPTLSSFSHEQVPLVGIEKRFVAFVGGTNVGYDCSGRSNYDGTVVTVHGTGLATTRWVLVHAPGSSLYHEVHNVQVISDTEIRFELCYLGGAGGDPTDGAWYVEVETWGGKAVLNDAFVTVPAIRGIAPANTYAATCIAAVVQSGDVIRLMGGIFASADIDKIKLSATECAWTVAYDDQINVTVPNGLASGYHTLTLTWNQGVTYPPLTWVNAVKMGGHGLRVAKGPVRVVVKDLAGANLTGSAAVHITGSAELTVTSPAGVPLDGAAAASVSASAVLGFKRALVGTAQVQVTPAASLVRRISVVGTTGAVASLVGDLARAVGLSGAALAQQSGLGDLQTQGQLQGQVRVTLTGAGTLGVKMAFSGAAGVSVVGAADLLLPLLLDGVANLSASAAAELRRWAYAWGNCVVLFSADDQVLDAGPRVVGEASVGVTATAELDVRCTLEGNAVISCVPGGTLATAQAPTNLFANTNRSIGIYINPWYQNADDWPGGNARGRIVFWEQGGYRAVIVSDPIKPSGS